MFAMFTDRSRRVMELADQEARRFSHEYIGTEHILLGLVKEGSSVATKVLKGFDVELRKVRLEVLKLVKSGPDTVTIRRLPLVPRTQKVFEHAIEEAKTLNHKHVGTEHLLLGLLREEDGVAAQVLMNLGLRLEDIRQQTLSLLGADFEEEAPSGPPVPDDAPSGLAKRFEDHPLVKQYRTLINVLAEQKDEYVRVTDYERALEVCEQLEILTVQLEWVYKQIEADPEFGL